MASWNEFIFSQLTHTMLIIKFLSRSFVCNKRRRITGSPPPTLPLTRIHLATTPLPSTSRCQFARTRILCLPPTTHEASQSNLHKQWKPKPGDLCLSLSRQAAPTTTAEEASYCLCNLPACHRGNVRDIARPAAGWS